ncbi:hypothetical protein JOL62DRAFT_494304, partial [Phyllosticta paracitricarpa]
MSAPRSVLLSRSPSTSGPAAAHAAKSEFDRKWRSTSTPRALQNGRSSSTTPDAVAASANPTRLTRPARARHGRVREGGRSSQASDTTTYSPASAGKARPTAAADKVDDNAEGRETCRTIPSTASRHRRSGLQCSLCGATFSRQEHLTRHVRSHADERPFACGVCGRRFTRRDTLKRHEARHQ